MLRAESPPVQAIYVNDSSQERYRRAFAYISGILWTLPWYSGDIFLLLPSLRLSYFPVTERPSTSTSTSISASAPSPSNSEPTLRVSPHYFPLSFRLAPVTDRRRETLRSQSLFIYLLLLPSFLLSTTCIGSFSLLSLCSRYARYARYARSIFRSESFGRPGALLFWKFL